MAAEKVVILAQDTTPLSYNSLARTTGLGPIGHARHPGRGLLLHTLQAFRLDRIPLGCAWAKIWAREPVSDTARRNAQSIDQKESFRWVEAYQTAATIATQMPQTAVVVCGDRESDIMDLYDHATVAPANLHFLIPELLTYKLRNSRSLGRFPQILEPRSANPNLSAFLKTDVVICM